MSDVAEMATLIYGYTMADLDRAARAAVKRTEFWPYAKAISYDDRKEAAWHAIVVDLYTRTDPPQTFHEVISPGAAAIRQECYEYRKNNGRRSDTLDGMAPNFKMYWLPPQRQKHWTDDGFSDRLCETMALKDALSVLTADQYEALATLAVFDNQFKPAAEALGIHYQAFQWRVYSGRAKIREVWFGDEQPVQRGNKGTTCRSGHDRATHGKFTADGRWVCRVCKRNSDRRRAARNR